MPREALIIACLAIGLLVSFTYPTALSSVFRAARLPSPLFTNLAVILSTLLLTQRQSWWLYLLAFYLVQVAFSALLSPYPLLFNVVSNLANVIEPLIGAYLFVRFVSQDRQFTRLRDVSIYVACVTVGALAGATWGATVRAVSGFPFWQSWQAWFLGDVLASLVLAPTIVLWVRTGVRGLRAASRWRVLEASLLGAALVLVGWWGLGADTNSSDIAPALLYLPVPLLVWAAVRFGPHGLVTALSLVTVMAIIAAANGLGPFQGRASTANVFTLQIFLLGVGLPLFLLAGLVRQQQLTQARYRVVVQSLPHGAVLLFGPDLRHELADGQGLADLGLTKQGVEGRTLAEAFPADLAAALEPRYRSALAGRHATFPLAHGARELQMDVLPVPGATSPTGMLVVHDVTEQKRAELLAQLDRAKTTFLSNISHELRTPLTLVLGPIEDALVDGRLGGEALEMVHRNVLRLRRLVETLLDFSRVEAGQLTASYQLTDVSALTADLASNFRSVIERAGLRFVVDTPPLDEDVAVYVDRDMVEKVVLNLISNAFRHTFDGEIAVSVRASDDGQHLELRVRDTGIGISAEEQTRIFERFYQVPGARSRSREGTGIGLALVAELVRLHGGSVTVESQLGRGSTFIVRLPVGASAMPGVPGATSTSAGPAGGEVRRRAPELVLDSPALREDAPVTRTPALVPGGRILVADDDADMRRYVGNILGEQWAVETTQDGAAALRAVQANPPDLLVLDVMLPELDGFEVLAALRRDPATRRLPVILLSARAGAEAAAEGLLAGADDYVSKPFAAAELSARVRTHLEVARARAEAEAAVRARDDFVAVVTHDLKHPLAAANWHLEVLRRRANQVRSVTGEDLADLLDALQASIQALTAQIDELRDATRLRAGQPLALERAPTDLVALARRIVLQYQDPAERHQLHFESTAPSLHGVWDPMRLERVLANLLSNAMKYSPTGSDISVRLARDGARALLEVEDHGVGIPAGDLPHIFERYRRGSNVAEHTRGSGLGLPGARDIVEQHGGTLSVTSIEGKGATFVISLPLAEDVEP